MQFDKWNNLLNSDLHWNLCLLCIHIQNKYKSCQIVSNQIWYSHSYGKVCLTDKICQPVLIQCRILCISLSVLFWTQKTSAVQLLLKDVCSSSYLWHSNLQVLSTLAWFSPIRTPFYWYNLFWYTQVYDEVSVLSAFVCGYFVEWLLLSNYFWAIPKKCG